MKKSCILVIFVIFRVCVCGFLLVLLFMLCCVLLFLLRDYYVLFRVRVFTFATCRPVAVLRFHSDTVHAVTFASSPFCASLLSSPSSSSESFSFSTCSSSFFSDGSEVPFPSCDRGLLASASKDGKIAIFCLYP